MNPVFITRALARELWLLFNGTGKILFLLVCVSERREARQKRNLVHGGGLQQLRKINILSASVPETLAKRSECPYLNFIILNQVIIAHFIATGRVDRWIALSGFLQCYLFLLGHYLGQELCYFIAAVKKERCC